MTSEVPAAFAEVFKDMDGSNVAKVNKALARALGGLIGQELDQVRAVSTDNALNFMTGLKAADVQSYAATLDVTAELQAAINANAGGRVRLPAGKYRLTSRLTLPMGTTLEGDGFGELPISDQKGTILYLDYLAAADAYGLYVTGSSVVIRDLEIQQRQPTPAVGWAPNVGPWAIYATSAPYTDAGGHRLTVDHVMLRNVYSGIAMKDVRGGFLRDIYGQPINTGIWVTGNSDVAEYMNIRLGWTFWTGDSAVLAWRAANATDFLFGRCDNHKGFGLFSWGAKTGYRWYYDTTHGNGNYDGVSSGCTFVGCEADNFSAKGFAIEDNPELKLIGWRAMPNGAVSTAISVHSYGVYNPGADYGDLRLELLGGEIAGPPINTTPAMKFEFTPPVGVARLYPQYIKISGVRIAKPNSGAWSAATPAIYAAAGVVVQAPDLVVDGAATIEAEVSRGTVQARQRAPYRNRLINGDFCVQQYGGAATIAANTTVVPIDRWRVLNGTAVNLTAQQIDAPAGFSGRKALQLTGTGVAAGAGYIVAQRIEAWMIADLDSRAGVVSFDLDASTSAGSLTGKVELYGNTAVDNGTYSALLASTAFTIPSGAGRVVVPLTAAQMAGVKYGCGVFFNFTQAGATGNPTIKFGGAQIEDDPTGAGKATPFEFRPYGVELTMSQRYFWTTYPAGATIGAASVAGKVLSWLPNASSFATSNFIKFPQTMRAIPTLTYYSPNSGASGKGYVQIAAADVSVFTSFSSADGVTIGITGVATAANDYMQNHLTASAEL